MPNLGLWAKPLCPYITALYNYRLSVLYTVINTTSLLKILPREYIVGRLSGRSHLMVSQVVFSGCLLKRLFSRLLE
jgi:hypothetical protein